MAQGADQRQSSNPRHGANQAAEFAQIALPRSVQNTAGGQKQQALEERMIERMDEGRGQREAREQTHVASREQNGQPNAGKDQSDVLNRGVSQQALHVGLDCRKDGTDRAEKIPSVRHDSPPPGLNMKQIKLIRSSP